MSLLDRTQEKLGLIITGINTKENMQFITIADRYNPYSYDINGIDVNFSLELVLHDSRDWIPTEMIGKRFNLTLERQADEESSE